MDSRTTKMPTRKKKKAIQEHTCDVKCTEKWSNRFYKAEMKILQSCVCICMY